MKFEVVTILLALKVFMLTSESAHIDIFTKILQPKLEKL